MTGGDREQNAQLGLKYISYQKLYNDKKSCLKFKCLFLVRKMTEPLQFSLPPDIVARRNQLIPDMGEPDHGNKKATPFKKRNAACQFLG